MGLAIPRAFLLPPPTPTNPNERKHLDVEDEGGGVAAGHRLHVHRDVAAERVPVRRDGTVRGLGGGGRG